MTIITSIKLKNFKSFRKADIPFVSGFTAIAGPNASGKSNVLDSLLFSMGITSLRLLRASKLTELVNHDATEGYAKVELMLKDDNGKEINVTRMIDRHGKSIYKLDGKRKTLNEIQSLLLELGVDPNGHNIVVQGDITRVIEMNPKQRRQVIEEVAGLSEFEEKKEEALKKLEKVEQKVKDAHLILSEREAYLQQLESDRENALRYNSLQSEMKHSKATILSEEINIIKKVMGKTAQNIEKLQKDIEEKRNQRDKLQEEERELESRVEDITKKLIEAGEKTYSSFGKDVEQKKGHINLLVERFSTKNEHLKGRQERIEQLKHETGFLEKLSKEKHEQLKIAQQELKSASDELAKLSASIKSDTEFEKNTNLLAEYEKDLESVEEQISNLREELHSLAIAKHGLERDERSAQSMLKDLMHEEQRVEQKISEKKKIEGKLEKFGEPPKEKLEIRGKEIEQVSGEIGSLKGRLETIEESKKSLSKAKSSCPICEQPLEKEKKDSLAFGKEKEISALLEKISKLEKNREELIKQKHALQSKEREYSELEHSLLALKESEDELSRIVAKISSIKEKISVKEVENLTKKEGIARKEIESLDLEKQKLESGIGHIRMSSSSIEMAAVMKKIHEISIIKNEKDSAVSRIKAELEHSIAGKIKLAQNETEQVKSDIAAGEKAVSLIEKEKIESEKELKSLENELEKANRANKLFEEEKERLTLKVTNISTKREELSGKIEGKEKEINEQNIEQSKNEVRIVDLEEEFRDYASIEPFMEFILNDLKKRIPEIEKEIEKLGAINMKSLENFDAFKKEVEDVRQKANKLEEERLAVVELVQKLDVKKLSVFMECFNRVSLKFSELYYKFFEGEGQLDLADKVNPLEGGLLIQAKYKEDTMKSIDAMSGGEKSMTALAFVFAIQSFEPAPFYIFDEVDAALDKENSIKVGRMIKEQNSKSQFIVISHNDAVINQADQIIGVAMNKHKSSVIGLRLKKGNQLIPAQQQDNADNEEMNTQATN